MGKPFPKPRSARRIAAHLGLVFQPEKLEHRVGEEKPAARRALPRMPIRRPLGKPGVPAEVRGGRTRRRAHKDVIDLAVARGGHGNHLVMDADGGQTSRRPASPSQM